MMKKDAQTMVEFVLFISVATVALYYMGPAMKRGLQALIKVTADQIGNQQDSDQDVDKPLSNGIGNTFDPNELTSVAVPQEYSGYLVESNMTTSSTSSREKTEAAYRSESVVDEITTTIVNTVTDMGFTKTR